MTDTDDTHGIPEHINDEHTDRVTVPVLPPRSLVDGPTVGIAAELQVAGGELPVRGADIFNARQETPIARCGCPESRHLREALETIRDIAIEPVESTMIKEIDETARAALRLEPLP